MRCPVCDEKLSIYDANCPACGLPIRKSTPKTGDQKPDSYKVCPDCNHVEPIPKYINREESEQEKKDCSWSGQKTNFSAKDSKIEKKVIYATGLNKYYNENSNVFRPSIWAALFSPLWFLYHKCIAYAIISFMLGFMNLGVPLFVICLVLGPRLVYSKHKSNYDLKNRNDEVLNYMAPSPILLMIGIIIYGMIIFGIISFSLSSFILNQI